MEAYMTTDNLSSFIQCAVATKVNDNSEFNYSVNIDECMCGLSGNLLVTAQSELEALENTWLHIISVQEEALRKN